MVLTPMLTLRIPLGIERRFIAFAKRLFKKEAYAILLGNHTGDTITVDELYVPDPEGHASTPDMVVILSDWIDEARELAHEQGLEIVGDIHSHPYEHEIGDRAQSEEDIDGALFILRGICLVHKANGKLRASIRWWGPPNVVHVKRI